MKIYFGADHDGNPLKEVIKNELKRDGYEIYDLSPSTPEGGDDYPDYAFAVAEEIAKDADARGILICDTGIGMSIAANKIKGARAALVLDTFGAKRAREHNDANIIVFGTSEIKKNVAIESTKYFLETMFSSAERHVRRVGKINLRDRFC
ncbi:MAG: RpiB/LacA/LacB family sugar-phosphate isomerase [bacterium]|nr:RpiB/LacA/LacB family sugar-phosphate isomerase [bacterium]